MIILPEDQNIVSLLSPEDSKDLLMALFSESDNVPSLSPVANVVYIAIKSKSDRISERKTKAGKQGGAPKNNQNAQKQAEQAEQAEQAGTVKTTYRTSTVSVTDTDAVDIPTGDLDQASHAHVREEQGAAAAEKYQQMEQLRDVYDCYEQNISTIASSVSEEIRWYCVDQELSREVVIAAILEAVDNNSRRWNYIRSILNRCIRDRIFTIEEWNESKQTGRPGNGKRAPPDYSDPAYYQQGK